MATKFFLYARKSSEAEERQAMSIEAQLHELTELANKENLYIAETFIESKSAKTPGRKEFARMIEKIHASKEPIGILAWHPDRLARNSVDGGQIIYLIDTKKIAALRFPTFWFEPTPQGLFMLQVSFGQSKYYSDNLSENIKRGIRQKIRRGEFYGGNAPVGYVVNPKIRNIEPDAVKAKIIQDFFKEFAEGLYNLETARHRLSSVGILCRNGNTYTPFMVYRLLTNNTYTGLIEHKGELHEGNFQPLIDKTTFETVQKKLKERARPRKTKKQHDFPFRGMFKCAECGGQITAQFAKGNGGTYRYYRCSKKFGICKQGYLREDLLLEQLKEQFQKIALPDDWAESMLKEIELWQRGEQMQTRSSVQNHHVQIKQIEVRMDKLVGAYLEGIIEKENYLKKKDELLKEKSDLKLKNSGFGQTTQSWVEPLKDWIRTAHLAGKLANSTMDLSEFKELSEKVGSNRLLKDKKIVFDWLPPFDLLTKHKVLQTKSSAEAELKKGGNRTEKKELLYWRAPVYNVQTLKFVKILLISLLQRKGKTRYGLPRI